MFQLKNTKINPVMEKMTSEIPKLLEPAVHVLDVLR